MNVPTAKAIHRSAVMLEKVFADNGWKWHVPEPPHVPSVAEIEERLNGLVDDICSGRAVMSECGRLSALLDDGDVRLFMQLTQ